MSGRALVLRLRQQNPTLSVIYTSGYTENTIVHHGVVDAGVDFLAKPYVSGFAAGSGKCSASRELPEVARAA